MIKRCVNKCGRGIDQDTNKCAYVVDHNNPKYKDDKISDVKERKAVCELACSTHAWPFTSELAEKIPDARYFDLNQMWRNLGHAGVTISEGIN